MEIQLDYFALKKQMADKFKQAKIDELSDFDWICCEVTGKKRSELALYKNFTSGEYKKIIDALNLRLKHIPLGYIFCKSEFYGRNFIVNKNVLIPRLDTEILVDEVVCEIKKQNRPLSVLELGVGSGAVIITISLETNSKCVGVDVSESALDVAIQNNENLKAKVKFLKSDLFENLKGEKFDIIVSNPPYIKTKVMESLDIEVKDFEPRLALDGGDDGLEFYKRIISDAPKFLNENGKLFFEIGYDQADEVSFLLTKNFKNVKVIKDYGGNNRVVTGEIV